PELDRVGAKADLDRFALELRKLSAGQDPDALKQRQQTLMPAEVRQRQRRDKRRLAVLHGNDGQRVGGPRRELGGDRNTGDTGADVVDTAGVSPLDEGDSQSLAVHAPAVGPGAVGTQGYAP